MPTYDYQCQDCKHHFELFQSIKDKPVKFCPECGGRAKRVISGGAGFIFKGSGFYETDYKKKESEKKGKTGSGEVKKDKKPKTGKESGTQAEK